MSFPESKTRRGRVIDDGDTCPTLDTGCEVGVVIVDETYKNRPPRFYEDYCPTLRGGVRKFGSDAGRSDLWNRERT